MGRYYSGDIDGKFWFAIQSSDSADRFGVCGNQPNYLDYFFCEENIKDIKKGIKQIKKNIGSQHLKLLKKFFKKGEGYNDEMIIKFFKENNEEVTERDVKYLLEEYADLHLGNKILKCVEDNGECEFTAEM